MLKVFASLCSLISELFNRDAADSIMLHSINGMDVLSRQWSGFFGDDGRGGGRTIFLSSNTNNHVHEGGGKKTLQHPQGFPRALGFMPSIVYPLIWGQISKALVRTLLHWQVWKNSWQQAIWHIWKGLLYIVTDRGVKRNLLLMREPPLTVNLSWCSWSFQQRRLTCGAQEVAFQSRAKARGIVLKIAHDEGLRGGVLIVDRPGLTPDTGAAVPGHVGHGEAVLKARKQCERERHTRKGKSRFKIMKTWVETATKQILLMLKYGMFDHEKKGDASLILF